ncbi:hypothetical protein IFM89_025365 [Coptis chinensis]|uniref:Uncharacterized protein n=1 Tax=Coptis chinensis TaxID=261450 RepID=A0A835HGT1_9MAGN|nr:hypothetical protein IFM89_025365 [Coptis chinensis]
MVAAAGGSSLLSKLVRPGGFRPQSTDIQAAVLWGVAAGTAAIWIVQNSATCFCEARTSFMVKYAVLNGCNIRHYSTVNGSVAVGIVCHTLVFVQYYALACYNVLSYILALNRARIHITGETIGPKTGHEAVTFKALYCGIDHTDLHQMRNEIHMTNYPLLPG